MALLAGWAGLCIGFVLGALWASSVRRHPSAAKVVVSEEIRRRDSTVGPGRVDERSHGGYAA